MHGMRRCGWQALRLLVLVAWLPLLAQAQLPEPLGCPAPCERLSLEGTWLVQLGDSPRPPTQRPSGGLRMKVPSNWNQQGLDLAGAAWFYRPLRLPAGRYALTIGGVDYAARVLLDGTLLGEHTGYFAPFTVEFEVQDADAPHLLAVRVWSPNEPESAWSGRKTLIKGVLGHHDTRPGGAWSRNGQSKNTGGIWGAVTLRRMHQGRWSDLRVVPQRIDEARAELTASAVFRGISEPTRPRFELLDPNGIPVAEGALVKAGNRFEATIGFDHPRRWWPADLGEQPLYRLRILSGEEGRVDEAQRTVGLRTVAQDAGGRLLVNGVPVFLRGTNYIATLYLAEATPRLVHRDLSLMRLAHVNAVRVHAHVTAPAFYEEADRLGMLVFQDFPLQWGYTDDPAFQTEALRQAQEMVTLLDEHPSVVHWTAHNEAPWSAAWMAGRYPDWDPDQNRGLDRALAEVIARADPTRPVQDNESDAQHAWLGWSSGSWRDFGSPVHHPFITEFGAQALPDRDVLAQIFPRGVPWPLTPEGLEKWEYHGLQLHELREVAKVPVGESLDDLVADTQRYQARLVQSAVEGLRRQKWQPVAGLFQFMFNEHWPSVSWGVVDYQRNPKPGYDALRRAYEPLLPIAGTKRTGTDLQLWIANDTLQALPGAQLTVQVGKREPKAFTVDVPANDVVRLPQTVAPPAKDEAVQLELRDAQGRVLSQNQYAADYFAP